jgi:hypothetical protein
VYGPYVCMDRRSHSVNHCFRYLHQPIVSTTSDRPIDRSTNATNSSFSRWIDKFVVCKIRGPPPGMMEPSASFFLFSERFCSFYEMNRLPKVLFVQSAAASLPIGLDATPFEGTPCKLPYRSTALLTLD